MQQQQQRKILFTSSIPNLPQNQFEREYDSSANIREIKDTIRKEFYIYPEIEFFIAKKKLDDQTILGNVVYDPIKIIIRPSDQLVHSILHDDIQKNKQRSQEVWVLVITNLQRKPVNDEFLNLKQNAISCYYNLDTKPMKFADLTNRQDLINIEFKDHKSYRQLLEQQFLQSNHKTDLDVVLSKILQVNWKPIYKIVIIFTDSKQCKINQWIKELFTNGYKLIIVALSDECYHWIKQQQNAYPVFEGHQFNLQINSNQNKELFKRLQDQLNNTLQATIFPLSQTTRRVIDDFETFNLVESVVKITVQDCNYDERDTVEETMEYIIPKLEYKQIDEIVEDLKKFKIKFISQGQKSVKYTTQSVGKGQCKTVYGAIINKDYYVIKKPHKSNGYTSLEQVELEIKNHLLAREIYDNFYYQFQKQGNILPANFGDLFVLRNNKGLYFVGERKYNGQEIKFNSNGGYVNDSIDHFNRIAQAFSVYSYIYSKKKFIVLDLQGFIMSDRSYVWFSDPAIVTFLNDFSTTDLGVSFSDQYLAQWDANKQIGSELLSQIGIK